MRVRGRLVSALVMALAITPALAYTVVTKDGRKLDATSAPEVKDGKATVTLAGGLSISLAASEIDQAATDAANKDGAAPKSFTNDDLKNARGLSDSGGSVTGDLGTAMPGARRSTPGAGASRKGASGGGRGAAPSTPEEQELAAAQAEVDRIDAELRKVVNRIRTECQSKAGQRPGGAITDDCDSSLFEQQSELVEELNVATAARDTARAVAHEAAMERYGGKMEEGDRQAARDALVNRRAKLEADLKKTDAELARWGSDTPRARELNSARGQILEEIKRVDEEAAAAGGD